jgi:hypothetical protein
MGEVRNTYKIFIGKPEGRLQLRRFKWILENNIKMDLNEIGCEDVDLIYLTQEKALWRALVNTVMNLLVP